MRYTDPNGEWLYIAIGALAGGIINWAAHGCKFDMDGLKAFGIGAAAGGIGAATFGVGLGAMGVAGAGLTSLGAVGTGGFATGFAAAAFSYMAATPILTGGNHIAFGDPLPTPKQYALGLGLSALGGGITQGLGALSQGNRFLDGGMTAAERSMINNAQVSAINQGQGHHMPNAASSNIDDVLMERIGHRQVNNFLNSRTSGTYISNMPSQAQSRVFWSGGGNAAVEIAAREFAIKNGMTTLEMTKAGQNMIKLTEGMPWQEASPMWD